MKIVVLTSNDDMNSRVLCRHLAEKGIEVTTVKPQDVAYVSFDQVSGDLTLKGGDKIQLESAFFINRLPNLDYNHPLITLLYKLPRNKVVTHPTTGASMLSKLQQLPFFNRSPVTEVIKGYQVALSNATCTKSISQIRSLVRASDDELFRPKAMLDMPVMLQELKHGKHIKAIIIGEDYYSFEFKATSLDPRENGFATVPTDTPTDLVNELDYLKRTMGANYVDIDIILAEGQSYLLEVNPSPAPGELAHLSGDNVVMDRFIEFISNAEYQTYA